MLQTTENQLSDHIKAQRYRDILRKALMDSKQFNNHCFGNDELLTYNERTLFEYALYSSEYTTIDIERHGENNQLCLFLAHYESPTFDSVFKLPNVKTFKEKIHKLKSNPLFEDNYEKLSELFLQEFEIINN